MTSRRRLAACGVELLGQVPGLVLAKRWCPASEGRLADLDERCELYRRIAEQVWNPDDLLAEVEP